MKITAYCYKSTLDKKRYGKNKFYLGFRFYDMKHNMTVLFRVLPLSDFDFWYDKRKNIITGNWKRFKA